MSKNQGGSWLLSIVVAKARMASDGGNMGAVEEAGRGRDQLVIDC